MKNVTRIGHILISIILLISCDGDFQENEEFIDQFFPIDGETCQEGLALPPNQVYIPIRWRAASQFQNYSISIEEINNVNQGTLNFNAVDFITLPDGSFEFEVLLNRGSAYKGIITGQSSSGNIKSKEFEFTTAFLYENSVTLPVPVTILDPSLWVYLRDFEKDITVVQVNWFSDDLQGSKGYRYDVYLDRTDESFITGEAQCPINKTFFNLEAEDLESTSFVIEGIIWQAGYALEIVTKDRRQNEASSCITFIGDRAEVEQSKIIPIVIKD